MTNIIMPKAKEAMLSQSPALDMDTDNFKVVGIDHAVYTPVPTTDQYLDDIPVGARVFTSGNLAGRTVTDGVFNADNSALTGVTGAVVSSLYIYKDTGVESTSLLIVYIDEATGLPYTPSGGDVEIRWSDAPAQIFAL